MKKKFRMMMLYNSRNNPNKKVERYIKYLTNGHRPIHKLVDNLKFNLEILNNLKEINVFINKYKKDKDLIKILKEFKKHIKYNEYYCEVFTFNVNQIKLLERLIKKYENIEGSCYVCNKKIKLSLSQSIYKDNKFYYFCSDECFSYYEKHKKHLKLKLKK